MKAALKNFGLLAASFLFAGVAVEFACKLYVKIKNIQTPSYLYENKIDMLACDSLIGFVNKLDFSGFCFGNIPVRTNDRGFRGTRPVSVVKKAGVPRIIGIGDSVMWGVGVRQEDSIMGLLDKKLSREKPCEVIDAGVIGYSTYQEMLFFEKSILPLKPDIVLVNLCVNDILYTEDPCSNLIQSTAAYISEVLKDPSLTAEERNNLKKLHDLLISGKNPFYDPDTGPEELKKLFGQAAEHKSASFDINSIPGFRKVLIEMPVRRMADACRRENIRLIYLFIPPVMEFESYHATTISLKQLLKETGGEHIDLQAALKPPNEQLIGVKNKYLSNVGKLLPDDIVLVLEDLIKQRVHKRNMYLDWVHPTIKGNDIIAECIQQYLAKTGW